MTSHRVNEGTRTKRVNEGRRCLEGLEGPLSVHSRNGLLSLPARRCRKQCGEYATHSLAFPPLRFFDLSEQTLAWGRRHPQAVCLRPQWTDCGGGRGGHLAVQRAVRTDEREGPATGPCRGREGHFSEIHWDSLLAVLPEASSMGGNEFSRKIKEQQRKSA